MELTKEELKALIGETVQTEFKKSLAEINASSPPRLETKHFILPDFENSPEKSLSDRLFPQAKAFIPVTKVQIQTKSAKQGGHFGNLPIEEKQFANILLQRDVWDGIDRKAFDSTTPGAGLEYIPDILQNRLFEDLTLQPFVHNMFDTIKVSQYEENVPNIYGNTHFKLTGIDGVSKEIANQTTGQTLLKSRNFVGFTDYSVDVDESSVVNILPLVQKNILNSWSRDLDDVVINGDDSGTHQDTDTQALSADYHLRAWKGLRKMALAGSLTTAGAGAGISTTLLAKTAKGLKKYSTQLQNLFFLVSGSAQWNLFQEADWKDQTLLFAKYGSESEIARGLSGFIKTIPIYSTEFIRSDLNASGVNGASANTFTTSLCVRKEFFINSLMKGLKIWVVTGNTDSTLATARKNRVYAEVKAGFNPIWTPSSTFSTVNALINTTDS